jgi:hypothetical protein
MLWPRQTGETVHSDDEWFVRSDGSMFPIAWWSAPIDTPGGRGAVLAFTDITDRLASEKAIRERDAAEIRAAESRAAQQRNLELADQQAALRRVATVVARGASRRRYSPPCPTNWHVFCMWSTPVCCASSPTAQGS